MFPFHMPSTAGPGLTPVKDGTGIRGETEPVEIPLPEAHR